MDPWKLKKRAQGEDEHEEPISPKHNSGVLCANIAWMQLVSERFMRFERVPQGRAAAAWADGVLPIKWRITSCTV